MKALVARLRAAAGELGFDRLGIADAAARPDAERFDRWVARGQQAGMVYLTRHRAERLSAERFFPGARSVLCVALNYYRPGVQPPGAPRVARYAWGPDYHRVLRARLRALLRQLQVWLPGVNGRVAVDTAPVLERFWAVQAGLGWIGRHGCLIVPGLGSWIFLGELFLDRALPADEVQAQRCGTCRRCLDACPGGALDAVHGLDARRCLSYWTVEHRGAFPPKGMPPLSPWLFGCDRCQEVCPWNRVAAPACAEEVLGPPHAALAWGRARWGQLTEEEFATRFARNPIARAGFSGIRRNLSRLEAEEGDG